MLSDGLKDGAMVEDDLAGGVCVGGVVRSGLGRKLVFDVKHRERMFTYVGSFSFGYTCSLLTRAMELNRDGGVSTVCKMCDALV